MTTQVRSDWMRVDEFLEANPGVARCALYRGAKDGSLRSLRVGRRLLIHAAALEELAQRQAAESGERE